jgi:hypothetical protein
MSEKRLQVMGVLSALAILAAIAIVHQLNAPVDQLGQAVGSTLRSELAEVDDHFQTPWGLPGWVLVIDNAIGMLLLAIMFLGGLPLAGVAIVLSVSFRSALHRSELLERFAPYCLVFQVSSLLLASAITVVALVIGGAEPFMEPWTWYHVATIPASVVAIPTWRRLRATRPLPALFNERPA